MCRYSLVAAALGVVLAVAPASAQQDPQEVQAAASGHDFIGTFRSMNGSSMTGMVAFKTTDGGRLIASLGASDMPEGLHMAHIHGFTGTEPKEAVCPTGDEDANGDGLVDLMETQAVAGKTLVPLTADPASLTIRGAKGYPVAGKDGNALYLETADLQALEAALKKAYDTPLALKTRVVFVHGLPNGVAVPDSVQSLPDVPAKATLPIACAEILAKPVAD